MATKEDILREQTFKEDGLDLDRRVFYTLNDGKKSGLQEHRNSKAIALIIKRLREKNLINDAEIDDILFDCVN